MQHQLRAETVCSHQDSYGVAVVIGTVFPDLADIANKIHVWAPDTPENKLIAEQTKPIPPEHWNDHGVTVYFYDETETAEDTLLSLLETVNLHHGEYSHDPPWTSLRVYGLSVTDKVREALAEYGVSSFSDVRNGFLARR